MVATKQKIIKNWVLLIIFILIGFLGIAYLAVTAAFVHTVDSADSFKSYVIQTVKKSIKLEVENRINEIEYDMNIIHDTNKNYIKNRIAFLTESLLITDTLNITDKKLKQNETLKLFTKLTSIDNELIYFLMDKTGVILSSGTDETLNGSNIMNLEDQNGLFFFEEILKSKDFKDGVFITHYWPKEQDGNPLLKQSFCYYIPELEVIIGTGFYEEDIILKLKENMFSRLNNYYKNKENYLFILSNDGTALVHGDPSLVGEDTSFILDVNGKSVTKQMSDIVKTKNEGFITYPYKSKNELLSSEKISFVKDLKNWNAYIGMGFYTEDLEEEISNFIKKFEAEHINDLKVTFLLFIILCCIMFYLVRRGIKLQMTFIKQEDLLFEKLIELTPEGIFIISGKGSVLYQNELANKLLNNKIKEYVSTNGKLNIPFLQDNIFKITNKKERVYFIKFRTENVIFHGSDSYIYFLLDITEEYIKSNKLINMALNDQLTNLPNRRKLLIDVDDISTNKQLENIIIVIIDLDDFKRVNDTYGHDTGDKVLITLGDTFNDRLRDNDTIYRYGGEEFIVILQNIDIDDSIKVLNSINRSFKELCLDKLSFPVTFSGGAISYTPEELNTNSFDIILKKVDTLLYTAKRNGKNRVVF